MENQKKNDENLTLMDKVELFFRDLFMLPSKDGKSRLVKNKFTGKWQWTKGESSGSVSAEELSSMKTKDFMSEAEISENQDGFQEIPALKHIVHSFIEPFEPFRNDRFIVKDFADIQPYFFNSYYFGGVLSKKKMANGRLKIREKSTFVFYIPIAVDVDLKMLELKKSKNIGNIKIELVDAIGTVVRTISLKNAKIEELDLYSNLTYLGKDDESKLQYGYVSISHDPREISMS